LKRDRGGREAGIEMEKRLLLATFLSIMVLILFHYLSPYRQTARYPRPEKKTTTRKAPPLKAVSPPEERPLPRGREYVFETGLTRTVLTDYGGVIKAIYLKQYRNDQEEPLNILEDERMNSFNPISIRFPDPELTRMVNNVLYQVRFERLSTSSSRPEGSISFIYEGPDGLRIQKIYLFNHQNYIIKAKILAENLPRGKRQAPYQLLWGRALNDEKTRYKYSYTGPLLYIDHKLIKEKLKDRLVGPIRHKGDLSWVGLESKYFLVALIPPEEVSTAFIEKTPNQDLLVGLEYYGKSSPRIEREIRIYAGPKEVDKLEKVHANLERAVDFGWFTFLATPLLKLLKYFYGFTHNYGLSIILLTVFIKIIFYPLSHKSYKSMKKLQEIQPKIKLIQERYKKDREKLNQEMLALYREYKVNPLSGCLPMLFQIPVFFALYRVLLDAIELRKAPFIWWIKDLSDKDPYYIWPVLMGLSMFIQQKVSPATGDPRQNKIMMFMPLIFTVMFLNFPVGLVVYWLVNNLLSILQQYILDLFIQDSKRPRAALRQ